MSYVTVKEMLLKAQKGNYAVGAFNAENMESIQGVISAAIELNAPVIIQTTPSMIKYASCDLYHAMVYALSKNAPVPVALHLDHGNSIDLVKCSLEAGYSSVMIDGSALDFNENIALSAKAVALCLPTGMPVEAELGSIGGKEDELNIDSCGYTDPIEALEFVKATKINSLAVSIGTAHGFYSGNPLLDKERLSKIKEKVDIPLVLHGASGLSDKDISDCIKRGICKVNFATELREAYTMGVKEAFAKNPSLYDPKEFGKAAIEKVKLKVKERILVCGANDKA